jgi:hypothetical protein
MTGAGGTVAIGFSGPDAQDQRRDAVRTGIQLMASAFSLLSHGGGNGGAGEGAGRGQGGEHCLTQRGGPHHGRSLVFKTMVRPMSRSRASTCGIGPAGQPAGDANEWLGRDPRP